MAERQIGKIVITGSEGTIGKVLVSGLDNYEITPVDLALGRDCRDYQTLVSLFLRNEAVIHLAWNTMSENWRSASFDPGNRLMAEDVCRAAQEVKVPRVVVASSVHADSWRDFTGPGLLDPNRPPLPRNAYGESKVFIENLGREYAAWGLMVICIRFGSVTLSDHPFSSEPQVYLSHRDLVSLVRSALEVKSIPNNFAIVYGVSDNYGRIHDISNPLGWHPEGA